MEAVRAQRAVQTMTQIMPRASLLAAVARLRRGVLVVLEAVLRQVLLPTTPFMVSTGTRVMRRPQQLSMLCNMLWLECSDSPSARGAGFVLPHSSWRRGCEGVKCMSCDLDVCLSVSCSNDAMRCGGFRCEAKRCGAENTKRSGDDEEERGKHQRDPKVFTLQQTCPYLRPIWGVTP